jgi:hypothetical protein
MILEVVVKPQRTAGCGVDHGQPHADNELAEVTQERLRLAKDSSEEGRSGSRGEVRGSA